jgi:hypothetical protein
MGSYIYMYKRGEYIKNPLEKYNNRKSNTYLISYILFEHYDQRRKMFLTYSANNVNLSYDPKAKYKINICEVI